MAKKSNEHSNDKELFIKYAKSKDLVTRNKLVKNNQPLVTYIVNKYYASRKEHSKYREDLLQEGTIGLLSAIDGFKVELGYKFSTYACVPLTTQILTKKGWKKWNEVEDGDETLGHVDGKSQWTKINKVVKYDNAPLVRFGDSKWNAVSTPQHKWLISQHGDTQLIPLTDWPDSQAYEWPTYCKKTKLYKRPDTQLITSVPFVGGKSSLTPNEAAILAWILSDGSIRYDKNSNKPKSAVIIQSENKFTNEIRTLLKEENAYTSDGRRETGICSFHVKTKIFRKIWDKSNLDNQSFSDLVLDLSQKARKAWFDAWYKAEGTQGRRYITQNDGEKLDAIALSAYLEGLQDIQVKSKTSTCSRISWHMRNRTPRRCIVTPNGQGAVWCPNTACGSWTARDENGSIFLTGNTWWIRQAVNNYLINIEPMIHVPSHVQTQYNKIIRKLKAENKTFQSLIENGYSGIEVEGNTVSEKMMRSVQSAIRSKYINSIDRPISTKNDSDGGCLKDILPENKPSLENLFDQTKLIDIVSDGLNVLGEREKLILLLRFDVLTKNELSKRVEKQNKTL